MKDTPPPPHPPASHFMSVDFHSCLGVWNFPAPRLSLWPQEAWILSSPRGMWPSLQCLDSVFTVRGGGGGGSDNDGVGTQGPTLVVVPGSRLQEG